MSVAVSTPVFEGPFDLLLHLILSDEVDLYAVRLADIVDAYLAEVERMAGVELEVATEFLLIAATLVELKVRRLLPDEGSGELDEELGLWEERDLLLSRLLECKTFKDVAIVLDARLDAAGRCHPRRAGLDERYLDLVKDPLEGVTPEDLRAACLRALAPRPAPVVSLAHVTPIRVSVAEAMAEVADEVRRAGRISFRRLVAGLVEKIDVIVRFLAMLELVKAGHVEAVQVGGNFTEIVVEWTGDDDLPARELVAIDAYDG